MLVEPVALTKAEPVFKVPVPDNPMLAAATPVCGVPCKFNVPVLYFTMSYTPLSTEVLMFSVLPEVTPIRVVPLKVMVPV